MSTAKASEQQPRTFFKFRPFRACVGLLLLLIGAGIAAYGLWLYDTADGYQIGQQPVASDWYHPQQLVIDPVVKHADSRGWHVHEIASMLNGIVKWGTVAGGGIALFGLYMCLTCRRRYIRIHLSETMPSAA